MPGSDKYYPPTDKLRDGFNAEIVSERNRRYTTYRAALRYYMGIQPEQLEEIDPDSEVDEPNDNTIINMVRMTADRTTTFLFPEIPKIDLDPDEVDETDREAWVRKAFEDNGGLAFFVKWALRGFLAGHTFIRVTPPTKKNGYPRMVLLDPLSVTVFWKVDDVAEVLWYEVRYHVGSVRWIMDIVNDPDNERWLIYRYADAAPRDEMSLGVPTHHGDENTLITDIYTNTGFKLVETEVWPTDLCPIQETPHLPHPNDYYGMGEATLNELQDTINRIWSMVNRIVRLNSDPKDVILGADVDEVQDGGNIITVPAPGAKVQRLEMRGDLSATQDTAQKLIETYLAISRVVLLKGEAKDLQRVTNASVRTLFIDAIAKNSVLQSSYGRTIKQLVRLLVQMSTMSGRSEAIEEVKVSWGSALPLDMTEVANVANVMVTMGAMSKRTAANTAGLDWGFETEAMETENEVAMERQEQQLSMQQKFAPKPAPGQEKPFKGE